MAALCGEPRLVGRFLYDLLAAFGKTQKKAKDLQSDLLPGSITVGGVEVITG